MLSSLASTVPISREGLLDGINDSLYSSVSDDVRYCGGAKVDERENRIFHYEEVDMHCTTPETDQELLEIFGSSGCSSVIAYGEEELKDEMVTHVIRRKSKTTRLDTMESDTIGSPLWSEVLKEKTKSLDSLKLTLPIMAAKSVTSKDEDVKKSKATKAPGPKILVSLTSLKASKQPPRRPPIPVAPNGAWIEVKKKSHTRTSASTQRAPNPQAILLSIPNPPPLRISRAAPPEPKTEIVKPKAPRSPKPKAAKIRDGPYEPRTTITNVFDEIPIQPRPKQPFFSATRVPQSLFLATLACLTIAPCL